MILAAVEAGYRQIGVVGLQLHLHGRAAAGAGQLTGPGGEAEHALLHHHALFTAGAEVGYRAFGFFHKYFSVLSLVLIGHPEGVALLFIQVDHATVDKAMLFQQMAHGGVPFMGIGPDVGANGFTACHTLGKYPLYRSVAGQAVDGTIGAVIEPRAVDGGVAGIVAQDERKKGMRRTVRAAPC